MYKEPSCYKCKSSDQLRTNVCLRVVSMFVISIVVSACANSNDHKPHYQSPSHPKVSSEHGS
jgi:hypothetical protein